MNNKVVVLNREDTSDQGTVGTMHFGAHSFCRTMELPWRDNEQRISCIPRGIYTCSVVSSPRFGRVYGVAAVPGRSHILIHAANFAGDKNAGWYSELEGCIAPCRRVGQLRNPDDKLQLAGLVSRSALSIFMAAMKNESFILKITGVCG